MTTHDRGEPARHPVLVLRIAQADGTPAFGLRVYCASKQSSVPLDVCRGCEHCVEIGAAPESTDSWVACEPPAGPSRLAQSVGDTLRRGLCAVEEDVPLRDVVAMFVERNERIAVVVDHHRRVVGVVREVDLLAEIQAGAGNPAERRLSWAVLGASPASSAMKDIRLVPERCSLREALLAMANAHERQILAVNPNGEPVGVLRDVEALLAYAAERRAGFSSPR